MSECEAGEGKGSRGVERLHRGGAEPRGGAACGEGYSHTLRDRPLPWVTIHTRENAAGAPLAVPPAGQATTETASPR